LSATFFMLLVDFSIVSIALPTIEAELHMSAAQGQWIVSTYAIILAGFLMLTGRCADLYGRFRFFIAGLALFTVGSFLGGIAHDGALLIAMRGVQGLGAAMVNPAALAIVLSMFPSGPARSRAIALWGTIGSTGIAAGMLFGGILVQYLGWRSVFFVNVPFALAIFALLPWFVPRDSPHREKPQLDVAGAATLTTALLTFVYTIEAIPERGVLSLPTAIGVFATLALLVLLVAIERRATEPILPKSLFRYPDLLSGAAVVMLQPMSYAGVLVFASMYAQRVAGYSALAAGLAFLPSSLVISFVASPLTMPIVRRIGVRAMGFATSALMVVGETILLFLHPRTPYWLGLFPATMIGGFGGMLAYQAGMIAGLGHVDDADEGSASAALSFALQLGIGFGVALGASAQELRTQALLQTGVAPSQAFAGGLQAAFWVCVAIGIANIVSIAGIRHAATAELPLRRYLPFGRLHHRVAARTP
jgi:EmrB/QacA subfamily drug resistance transporter